MLEEGISEAGAVDPLHRDVHRALIVAPVVDGDDARVMHGRRRVRGLTEAANDLRVTSQVRTEDLQGHRPAEPTGRIAGHVPGERLVRRWQSLLDTARVPTILSSRSE